MRRSYTAAIAAIIVAAALASFLAASVESVSIIYYTDFSELPPAYEMGVIGATCKSMDGTVKCTDQDGGPGSAGYYIYSKDVANTRLWISSKTRFSSSSVSGGSTRYGLALLSSGMEDKAYFGFINSSTGKVSIFAYNLLGTGEWQDLSLYLTGRDQIPNYDPSAWYVVSFVYVAEFDAVHMYFQVNDTSGNILAEVWASSYYSNGGFAPSYYIGLAVDNGAAQFDYFIMATQPVTIGAAASTSTVTTTTTATVTSTQTVTEAQTLTSTVTTTTTQTTTATETTTVTVANASAAYTTTTTTTVPVTFTSTVSYTVTATETVPTTVTEARTYTVTSPVYVRLYRTATETVTAAPESFIGLDKFAIAVAILIMATTVVFMLRNR